MKSSRTDAEEMIPGGWMPVDPWIRTMEVIHGFLETNVENKRTSCAD